MRGSMEPCLKFRLKQARVFRSGHAATLLNLPPIFQPPEVGGLLPMERIGLFGLVRVLRPRNGTMRKVEDYKRHAEECRAMARNASNEEHRQGLVRMAETWESLATDRLAQLERLKRLEALDQLNDASKCA